MELGLEMMLLLKPEEAARGKEILYGHIPIAGTGEFEDSRVSYGMGLNDQSKMWNAGFKQAVYVDGQTTYNSVNRSYLSFLVGNYFGRKFQMRLRKIFERFPESECGIPHGFSTSHFLFYLLRLEIIKNIGIEANKIKMLSDDTFIFGADVPSIMKLRGEFESQLGKSGIGLNYSKERLIEQHMFEDGTWAFDLRDTGKQHNSIVKEIMKYGDWRKVFSAVKHKRRFSGDVSSSTDINSDVEERQTNYNEMLLWEDLVELQLREGLHLVDPQIVRRSHYVLAKYGSSVIDRREFEYLRDAPYSYHSLYKYSQKAGHISYDPCKVLDTLVKNPLQESFSKANLLRYFGHDFPNINREHLNRISDIALDADALSHLRVTALRELKVMSAHNRVADVCLLTKFNNCLSWNLERIDATNVLSYYARRKCLEELAYKHEYDIAIDVLCA